MKNDSIEKITDLLFINKDISELTHYDLIIVLGNNFYEEIALCLKDLLNKEIITENTEVIISGNKGKINANIEKTEAEIIYENIKRLNINLNCILEKEATNIKENLLNAKELINDLSKYNRILLICKSFVSRRTLMCADALNYPLDKIDIYGLEREITKKDWHNHPKSTKRVLEELERISIYCLKGDLKL